MVEPNSYRLSTRAASIAPAIPVALSFAPGASVTASFPPDALESMSPAMMTYRFGWTVPRWIATTFTIQVSSGTRLDAGVRLRW